MVYLLRPAKEVGGWYPVNYHQNPCTEMCGDFFMRARKYFLTFLSKYETITRIKNWGENFMLKYAMYLTGDNLWGK